MVGDDDCELVGLEKKMEGVMGVTSSRNTKKTGNRSTEKTGNRTTKRTGSMAAERTATNGSVTENIKKAKVSVNVTTLTSVTVAVGVTETVNAESMQQTSDRHAKQENMNKLQALLTRAQAYSKFLAERLQEQIQPLDTDTKARSRGGADAELRQQREADPLSRPQGETKFCQPKMLKGTLRPYQLEGVQWLVSLFENGLNGILADEMGLGKTVQCIGLLAFLQEQGVTGPFLVVAPLSTLDNWMSELKQFAPEMTALMYHGSAPDRTELRKKHFSQLGKRYNVVVTSYEIAMRDARYLASLSWKHLIIDEGHRLKNLNCRLIRELRTFRSDNRLLITGTPLQNNLTELWSLLNFLLPEIFTNVDDFLAWFDLDGEEGVGAETVEAVDTAMVAQLHAILKPLLLRRLKIDVETELPKKREYVLSATLTPLQREYYQTVAEGRIRQLLYTTTNAPVPKKRVNYTELEEDDLEFEQEDLETKEDFAVDLAIKNDSIDRNADNLNSTVVSSTPTTATAAQGLQNKIMQLRKVCNHPYLFRYPTLSDGTMRVDGEIVRCSGKMRLLEQLLMELRRRGHKVLIFSQMSRMLDLLAVWLELRHMDFSRIDGSVAQPQRQEEIRRFNKGTACGVFLLSTRAGGLGLNLIAADTVIFYDSDWAQDRVHRIGQTKPVLIFRLSTANTAEGRMLASAASKRRLERLVIHKKKFKGRQQLLAADESLLAEDLAEILGEGRKEQSLVEGEERDELTRAELKALLDRSDAAFERHWDTSTIKTNK